MKKILQIESFLSFAFVIGKRAPDLNSPSAANDCKRLHDDIKKSNVLILRE